MTTSPVAFAWDPQDLARFRARLERWRGAPLGQRMAKGALKAADYLVRPIRAETPRETRAGYQRIRHRPGWLRASVRARAARGEGAGLGIGIRGAIVGPTAPHRHLVIRGTRPHSLATRRPGRSPYAVLGIDQVRPTRILRHPGSQANPFVDRAAQRYAADVLRVVSDVLFEG
jgi:hypothetical protein